MVNEVLQTTSYHGLNAGSAYESYDNGFCIWKADAVLGCSSARYIPYMSCFGGISVGLLPNNMVHNFFSDNAEYTFSDTAKELNKIGISAIDERLTTSCEFGHARTHRRKRRAEFGSNASHDAQDAELSAHKHQISGRAQKC